MASEEVTSTIERRRFLERAAVGAGMLVAGKALMAGEPDMMVKAIELDKKKIQQAEKLAPRLEAARSQDLAGQLVKNLEQYQERVVDPKLKARVDMTIKMLRLGKEDMVAYW
jgi:hypothetical protein